MSGTVYLIHWDPPLHGRVRHYCGFTSGDVTERYARHVAGRGAGVTRAAARAGARFTLARTWDHADQHLESELKRSGHLRRYCPICEPTAMPKTLTDWTTIRVPRHVADLIEEIEGETLAALHAARIDDFPGYDPDRDAIAKWGVILKALRDFQNHRTRSRGRAK